MSLPVRVIAAVSASALAIAAASGPAAQISGRTGLEEELKRQRQDAPFPWMPQPSGQFACDFASAQAKGQIWSAVENLPGGSVVKSANDVVDPLINAAMTQGTQEQQVAAVVQALGEMGASLIFPQLGVFLTGGKLLLAGETYAIEQVVAAARDQQARAMLTGYGGPLGGIGNIGAQVPFIPFVQRQARYRNLTFDTLGQHFRTEAELNQAWGYYVTNTRGVVGEQNMDVIWRILGPKLVETWRAQRTLINLEQAVQEVMRAIQREMIGMRSQCERQQPATLAGGVAPAAPPAQSLPATYNDHGAYFCCQWTHPAFNSTTCAPETSRARCASRPDAIAVADKQCSGITGHCDLPL